MIDAVSALSPFELVAAELRAVRITLARLPGEYTVNFRNGRESTARIAETLDEAVALGRTMAADAPAAAHRPQGKRRRRPPRMTPKAIRRRMIRQHNRRLRVRALRRQREEPSR
jgi:hypothetical protein